MNLVGLRKKFPQQHNLSHKWQHSTDEGKITDLKGFGFNEDFEQSFHDSYGSEFWLEQKQLLE